MRSALASTPLSAFLLSTPARVHAAHRRVALWCLLAVLLTFLAPSSFSQSCPSRSLDVDRPLITREGCAAWRWIAIRTDLTKSCPQPAGAGTVTWDVRPLFEPSPGDRVPQVLLPYCLYQAKGASKSSLKKMNRQLRRLARGGSLGQVAASCAAVAPMSGASMTGALASREGVAERPEKIDRTQKAWRHWRDYFRIQAEALEDPTPHFEPISKVRVAVLDTQPGHGVTGLLYAKPSSMHGLSLAHLLEELVCVGDICAARVDPFLALPISEFDWQDESATRLDPLTGGFFGTIDQLAEAVWTVVRDSRRAEKLILNLSVAWSGERWGGLEAGPEEMAKPIRSLFDALQVASCKGALVIAAAGNRLGGPEQENGPLLPAGWERHEAPGSQECAGLMGEHAPDAARFPRPLVYAAGGIRGDGSKLPNARPGSEPARVAFADHAVVDQTSETFTGSSIAALLTTAAAAVAWSHLPEFSGGDVMRLVEEAGWPLSRKADVHLGATASGIRRIGICTALAAARDAGCRQPGSSDSCPYTCEEPPSALPQYPEIACPGKVIDFKTLSQPEAAEAFCGLSEIVYDPAVGPPKNPCPYRQFFGIQARPWAGTQPQSNPCSGCDIRPPPDHSGDVPPVLELRIEIDSDWKGGPLSSVILALGEVGYALDLELKAGECALLKDIDSQLIRAQGGVRPPIRLHFTTEGGASVESSVFIGGYPEGEKR